MIPIPGYQTIEQLYTSNRTLVYRAKRDSDDTPVVLKMLSLEYPDAKQIAQFKREYEMVRHLLAPGVIRAYRLEKWKNSFMIVFEDIGATSLDNFFPSPAPDIKKVLALARKIIAALGEVHQHKIIHKDINPSNIIWNPETGEVRLIDFGISTELSREMPMVQNPHELEGTLSYLSPEQTGRMNRGIDYRTDFYSFGVTLYEMLSGQLPFEFDDPIESVHSHIAKTPTPPNIINPAIPKTLSDIILKLLEKTAEDRYQSAFGINTDIGTCLEHYSVSGTVPDLAIGQQDISQTFQVTQKLYGREAECDLLLNTFQQANQGAMEIILVAGYAGVGKSALVHEVHKPIVQAHGYFLEGKCDQFHRNVPYAPLIKAFQNLIGQLLSEPTERLESWKQRLLQALGANAQVIIDLIPQLEDILGKHSPVQELNPTEAQNRFLITFRNFVKTFAHTDYPLVIFLDDLHWADIPTLNLLEHLLQSKELEHFLVIGAYRNNEVQEGHPLLLALERLQRIQPIHQMLLAPLGEQSVRHILADTLHADIESVSPLTAHMYRQTEGNPLFVNEVLNSLYQEGLIFFQSETGEWTWDLSRIKAAKATEHVVDFLIERLKKLPEETQAILQLAACIGSECDLKVLSLIAGQSPPAVAHILWKAIREGMLLPLNPDYQLVSLQEEESDMELSAFGVKYRFRHDRIQQAAYALVPDNTKQEIHLRIGRLLLKQFAPEEREENVLDIVNQLNEGRRLIDSEEECLELVRLNVIAGKKAMSAVAYNPAWQYLTVAKELLPDDAWEHHYQLTFDIYHGFSACAYLCGAFEPAEAHCEILLEHARSRVEQADVRKMQLVQYSFNCKFEEAIQAGIQGLVLLDIPLTTKPKTPAILKEFLLSKWNLGRRRVESLVEQPLLTDPTLRLSMKLLFEMVPPTYMSGNANLFALVVLKLANLLLRHGNSPESATGYVLYAIVLAGMGDLAGAYRFGTLALTLNDRFDDLENRCRTFCLYALFSHSWTKHWKTLPFWFKKAIYAGLQSGDFLYLCHACAYTILWDPTIPLDEAIEQGRQYLSLIKTTNYQDATDIAEIYQRTRLILRDGGDDLSSLTALSPEEQARLQRMHQQGFISGVAEYHLYHLQLCAFYEDYQRALTAIREADSVIQSLMGSPFIVEFCLFTFLALAAFYPEMPSGQKKWARKRLRKNARQMKKWTRYCPENFQHYHLLMEAELSRLAGKHLHAGDLYAQAIRTARQHEYLRCEAIANELTAKFYRSRNLEKIAEVYFKDAHSCYTQWGAYGKARALTQAFPEFFTFKAVSQPRSGRDTETSTSVSSQEVQRDILDLSSVLKSSRAISSEIILEDLLKTLIGILIENAGAQQGMLLFQHEQQIWKVAADAKDQSRTVAILELEAEEVMPTADYRHTPPAHLEYIPAEQLQTVSGPIVNYVIRTGEYVILHNAAHEGKYTQEQHIQEYEVKSVLCMPLQHAGKRCGVLYLENNLVSHAFTEDRIEVLQALLAQAAISIENANLYNTLEQKVKERTLALEQEITERKRAEESATAANQAKSTFLANMSHELRTPLNAILGFTRIMARSPSISLEEQENLNVIQRSGEHLLTLINQVLDLSKIEAGRIILNEKTFNLYRLLDNLEDMFSLKAQSKDLQLTFERTEDVPQYIHTDEVKLRQVLINLLSNAVKFTEEGGVELRVSNEACSERSRREFRGSGPEVLVPSEKPDPAPRAPHPAPRLQFSISDTGPGIAPEETENLFEAFVQTKTGLQAKEGTGLGLAISRKFVELMDGEITVHSDVGLGTTFTFHISGGVVNAADIESEISTRRVLTLDPEQRAADGGYYRLLIVDDQPDNRTVLTKLLSSVSSPLFGFELREAGNGQEAMTIWEHWHPHAILMDMRMPVMDGYEATKKIRKAEEQILAAGYSIPDTGVEQPAASSQHPAPRTVIIAVTASTFAEEQKIIFETGCDDFLRKPFRENEVFDILKRHLGVRFVYGEDERQKVKDKGQPSEDVLTLETLAVLPEEVFIEFRRIVESVDLKEARKIVGQIRPYNGPLADALAELVKDYRFDVLQALFETGDQKT